MKPKLIHPNQYKISNWTGGQTTELFIFPEDSQYANRDFLFRISSATLIAPSSDFTILPGVQRDLLLLEGALLLNQNQTQLMLPGDIIHFDGGIETACKGTGVDFNIMCKKGYTTTLNYLQFEEANEGTISIDAKNGMHLHFYCFEGQIIININHESIQLLAQQSLYLYVAHSEIEIQYKGELKCKCVLSQILEPNS